MSMGKIEDRIKKMKEAIKSEANQRALNIAERAQQQADIERNNIIKQEKQKIDLQFIKQIQIQKTKAKIQKSSVVNRHRLLKMQHRHKFIEQLKQQFKQKLKNIMMDQNNAKKITQNLIVQGMLKMMQKNILIESTQQQKKLIKFIIPQCQNQFVQIIKKQTGRQTQVSLGISDYLLQNKQKNIIGGVFLRSQDGLIVCDNSLDARVDLALEQLLPEIRVWLFPKMQQQTQSPSPLRSPLPSSSPSTQLEHKTSGSVALSKQSSQQSQKSNESHNLQYQQMGKTPSSTSSQNAQRTQMQKVPSQTYANQNIQAVSYGKK